VIREGITIPVAGCGYVSRMVPTLSSAGRGVPDGFMDLVASGPVVTLAGRSPATLAGVAPASSSVPPAS
jgi:hypothetical protein